MKKIISLLLALAMICSLAVPAMAAEDTRTIYFENTANWSTVNAYYWGGAGNTWPGTAMTKVEGEENIYSIEVPTDEVNMIFNDGGSAQTADLTIPTDGKNLYSFGSGSWSTYSSAGDTSGPTINGEKEGDVTANYTPVIKITDIVLSEREGNGSVTVDEVNKTYTITIPADADETDVTITVSGQNLDKASEDYLVSISESIELPLSPDYYTYDSDTGNVFYNVTVIANTVDGSLKYSTDGGNTWTGTGWSTVVRKEYKVTVNAAENGSVTANLTAAEGETVELFVTAAEGYELDTLSVTDASGNPVTVNEDHTFTMPAGDVTVTATFKAAQTAYNITISESENGTVVAMVGEQQATSANHNDDVTLVVTPAEGYRLSSLTVKDASGNDVTVTDSNTFVMPESDVTVNAVFEKVYTVTTEVPYGNGIVTANTTAAVGETVTVTFTPNAGYVLFEQYACGLNNSTETVELTPGTEANTYTFQMPAFDVLVAGHIVKDGKARDDLYINNGGNTAWTNVTAFFYTDTGHYIDAVSLTMAEDGIYTLPEGAVIPNLAYLVQFASSENGTAIVDIPTDENNMFTLGTTNEDGQYEGTWSVYTPSQAPEKVTSAEIVWGSLSFTYTDGENGTDGAWSNDSTDGAGTVTVKNTGDNTFSAQPVYTAEAAYDEIEGKFYNSADPETPITMGSTLDSDETVTFILKLVNKPEKAIPAGTKIGTVTITITEGAGQ